MCNAWNHRPGCDCGWGGEGHLGGGGNRWNAQATWVGGYDLNSPNANCPICGERVFFIRPRNGGCGWFDAMGSPWPKHPCMDSTERRARFPSPLTVPATPFPGWGSPGWNTAFAEILPSFNEKRAAWSIRVGYNSLLVAKEPPAPVSPVYFRSTDETGAYGEIEYLAALGEEVALVSLHSVEESRRLLGRANISGYPPTIAKDDWAVLEWFLTEGLDVKTQTARRWSREIDEECDWLLDPGWQYTDSGPTLVRSRVAKILEGLPGPSVDKVHRWIALLL